MKQDALEWLRSIFPKYERGGTGRSPSGGADLELSIKNRLNNQGAIAVKSGGSRGPFDIVAVVPERYVVGIQVKRGHERWYSPIAAFPGFIPVLLRRVVNGWKIEVEPRPGKEPLTDGSMHPVKLSDEDIQAIKSASGTQQEIAERYGIDRTTVSKIKRGTYNQSGVRKAKQPLRGAVAD